MADGPQTELPPATGLVSSEVKAGRPVGDVLGRATNSLKQSRVEMPGLDARLLLAEAMALPVSQIHAHSRILVEEDAVCRLDGFLERRQGGEPVHRIIGRRAFYEHEFRLSPGTLEPRPDTETLVDVARPLMAGLIADNGTCRFADIGTGTGAIAISLLALFPQASAIAVDICDDALATARLNADDAGVSGRLDLVRSNYLDAVEGPLDLLVSNPPYIPHRDIDGLDAGVRLYDPVVALDGGLDGLDAYRAIAAQGRRVLKPGGFLVVEIGIGQHTDVDAIFTAEDFAFDGQTRDLGGVIRVLVFRCRP